MCNHIPHDSATLGALALTSNSVNVELSTDEDAGDSDEPPDLPPPMPPVANHFKRTPIRGGNENHQSLLTKALLCHSEDEAYERNSLTKRRRRSITSNISIASTADLTCDTGITTPARTSSPSPRLPDIGFVLRSHGLLQAHRDTPDPAAQALAKKRCISFACAAKPTRDVDAQPPRHQRPTDGTLKPTLHEAPKRPSIKFACPAQPSSSNPRYQRSELLARTPMPKSTLHKDRSPSAAHKNRSPSTVRSVRSVTPRRLPQSPTATHTTKFLTANSKDLQSECSRFHEFARDEPQEDDWIRLDGTLSRGRITIDDTLEKENAIRKLGKEAEEEAELEEEIEGDDDEDGDDDDDDETAGANDDDGDLGDDLQPGEVDESLEFEDDYSGYGSDDDASDGYNTDNEVGFADSDDEDDDLVLWTTGQASKLNLVGPGPLRRRSSLGETCSDSSARIKPRHRSSRAKDAAIRSGTPELPDSTDFVCGTLDEDRPLEEAYISRITARKREKLHPIPQDIDPSFPTSEPEDDAEDMHKHDQGNEDHVWPHGELEDIHHETNRGDRWKRKRTQSPKRHHSPPPKRHHSPAPKLRGRSPRRLFEKQSPRRWRSPPPPQAAKSPTVSPIKPGQKIAFKSLAFRPGLVYTKSLPRTPAVFSHMKKRRHSHTLTKGDHVRGAIDIVKGLEQKRQRRKEKFYQKYCSRARKNHVQERRPAPGQGAQRMREVGLIMAGKIGPGNYVLSV
ncbi:hypothetical protein QBC33DRAFT_579495 [Phialemonium atrogriseum]|uniref:Uncharacterized protein n=1 Tax=Phialemonium atrogriseum TaxID=1093897 RepID=A0AAJ0FM55_9PEZI|nr:uncharacterized protein QBC33DRAFT_579495 [Phialemonium atrogriseum]KAK1765795.1 hypothetical protein QBC33DRAFT_579495 [Phialemonium atrogriseum]